MNFFIALCAAITVVGATCPGPRSPGLKVTYDVFNTVPVSISDAETIGWVLTTRPPGLFEDELVMLCPDHKTLCCLYDDTGYIAGMQVSLCENEITDRPLNFEEQGFTAWSTEIDETLVTCWAVVQYYVTEVTLTKTSATRLQLRDSSSILQEDAVWVTDTNKQLLKIPRDENLIENEGFTKQACLAKMGQHYYYNMSAATECTEQGILPWFALYDEYGQLIGVPFMSFGKTSANHYYEKPPAYVIQAIVNNGPSCLAQMATDHGGITMHNYFCINPQDITCEDCTGTE